MAAYIADVLTYSDAGELTVCTEHPSGLHHLYLALIPLLHQCREKAAMFTARNLIHTYTKYICRINSTLSHILTVRTKIQPNEMSIRCIRSGSEMLVQMT